MVGGAGLVGSVLIYLWVPDLREFAAGALGVSGVLLLLALASSFVAVRAYLTGQRGRYTVNAFIMVLVALAIAALVNFISYRNPQRLDTTATQHFSLAPQTVEVLKNLKVPVQATAFFTPARSEAEAAARQRADDLMSEFQRRSVRKFTYRFEDPEKDPGKAAQYNVTEYPVIVFEASERLLPLRVPPLAEQDLTSAILIITGAQQKTVYFLTGHGEKDPSDSDGASAAGFGFAARGVFADNYGALPLNLAQRGTVPPDVAVLVVAGPTKELLTTEKEELLRWLKDGGRALFLLDPGAPSSFQSLLAEWGVLVGSGTVVDLGSSVHQAPRTPLIPRGQYINPGTPLGNLIGTRLGPAVYFPTTITNRLDVTFLPNATPLNLRDEYLKDSRKIPPWVAYSPLALSSAASFATDDPKRDTFRQGVDTLGPHWVALALHACAPVDQETPQRFVPDPEGRGVRCQTRESEPRLPTSMVVIGDSEFANNKDFYAYTNGDLFLNAVNWLARDYDLISIRSKPFAFRELVVTTSQFNFIRYSSWFLLPAAIALLGIVAWWRRR
jgi:hypothetical protein